MGLLDKKEKLIPPGDLRQIEFRLSKDIEDTVWSKLQTSLNGVRGL